MKRSLCALGLIVVWTASFFLSVPTCDASVSFNRLREYVKDNPNNLKAVYKLGKGYFRRGEYTRAIKLWRYILRRKRTAYVVYNRIGLAYFKLGEWERAIKVFKFVLKRDGKNRYARKALATIFKKMNKTDIPDGSAGPVRVAKKVDKEAGRQQYNDGMSLFFSQDYNKALAKFELALSNEVRVPDCQYYIGECKLKEAEDIDGAIKAYNKALEMKPDDPKCYLGLGFAHGLKGRVRKQIELFEKVLDLDSNSGEAHFQLSLAYDKFDNSRKTFEHAQKAIKIDPNYKKKLQPLIKNSNVARKIGKIITDVLAETRESQLTDEQIERYASKIGEILGEDNLRTELTTDEGKAKIRDFMRNKKKVRRLREAFKTRNTGAMKEILRDSDIDVDVDKALDKYKKHR